MTLKPIALALALCVSGPAIAGSCTSTFSLGTLGTGTSFGNSFSAAGSFNDCYTFTLDLAPSSATTTTVEWDWSERFDIDLASVTLSGGTLSNSFSAFNTQVLTFSNLTAGDYTLSVAGNVYDTGSGARWLDVGYRGVIATSGGMVTPVPEPESFAMLVLGLGVVAWVSKRKI